VRARWWIVAAALVCGACSQPEPAPTTSALPEQVRPARVEPIAESLRTGLEVVWWIADDADGSVARAMAGVAGDDSTLPESVRAAWEADGLRLVAIDEEDLLPLLEQAPPILTLQRQWIGRSTGWAELFQGLSTPRGRITLVNGIRESLPAHRLRLLARAWPAPSFDGPVMRLDIVPQLRERVPQRYTLDLQEPTLPQPETEGRIFDHLAAELALDPQRLYVLTCETPGVRWILDDLPEPQAETDVSDDGARYGPRVDRVRTLGETMLSTTSAKPLPTPVRAIVVLIPRGPDRVTVLP
jgi:hypothetical protein